MRVRFSAAASTDLEAAIDWYLGQSAPVVAESLIKEVRAATAVIGAFPNAGSELGGGCRVIALKRFSFSLVYRASEMCIEVVAVSHQSRRPDWWGARDAD